MQRVHLLSDLPSVDQTFVDAVAQVGGVRDVLVLDTFMGLDRETGAMADTPDHRRADIYIEWRRVRGQYGLEICLFGPPTPAAPMSEAEFARKLAIELRRPLVLSDCHANPYSYLRFNPDGAIYRVFTRVDDEDGNASFDLVCDLDPDDPDYIAASLIWPVDEPLPPKPADAPEHMVASMRRFCLDTNVGARLCEIFWSGCPYERTQSHV